VVHQSKLVENHHFNETFNKYTQAVANMPGLWKQSNQAAVATRGDLERMSALLMAHAQTMARIGYETTRVAEATQGLGRVWTGIVSGGQSLVASLEVAIGHMGKFMALGAGAIGLGGGLWGIGHLAGSVASQARGARHPETDGTSFDFLGLTHVWGRSRNGKNMVRQVTARRRQTGQGRTPLADAVRADGVRQHR
jgi:hypothetical protein